MATKKGKGAKPSSKSDTGGSVAWDKLKHARGSAKLLPTVTATLRDPAKATAALDALTQALVSRGEVYSASAPAFALLSDALAGLDGERRLSVVHLLLQILALGEPTTLESGGLDLGDAKLHKRYASSDASGLIASASSAAPALVKLLDDGDARVRGAAATLLGFISDAAAQTLDGLLARVREESDLEARVRAILATAYLGMASPAATAPVRSALAALQSDKATDAPTRGAALIALASIDKTSPDTQHDHAALVAFFTAALAFSAGPITPAGDLALSLLGGGRLGEAGRRQGALAALEAMVAAKPKAGTRARATWPNRALEWFFPERKGAEYAFAKDPLDLDAMSKDQRRLLELLSTTLNEGASYEYRGIPSDVRARRRLLGLEPAGPLEERVRAEGGKQSVPRWQALQAALDQYGKLKREKRPPLYDFVKGSAFELSPEQRLDMWTEVEAGAYRLQGDSSTAVVTAMERAPAEVVKAWAARRLEELLHGPDPSLRAKVGWVVLLAVVRPLGDGETIPEKYDAALGLAGPVHAIRAILEHMPPARREKAVERLIEEQRARPPLERLSLLERIAKDLLDLVPESTAVILRELDRPENRSIKDTSDEVDEGFDEHREDHARIDAILKDYEKQQKKKS